MNILSRTKHWQVFLLFALLFFVTYNTILPSDSILNLADNIAISACVIFIVYWAIIAATYINLKKYFNEKPPRLFIAAWIYVAVYAIVLIWLFVGIFGLVYDEASMHAEDQDTVYANFFVEVLAVAIMTIVVFFSAYLFLIPFHILCAVAVFYCIFQCALLLANTDKDKRSNMLEIPANAFLLIFYPIGVWFIQPRLNKLSNNK